MGENTCKQCDRKGLNSKIYKQLIQLNSKNANYSNGKWAKDLNRHTHLFHCETQYTYIKQAREIQVQFNRSLRTQVKKQNISRTSSPLYTPNSPPATPASQHASHFFSNNQGHYCPNSYRNMFYLIYHLCSNP